jgi:heme-degrading monooxygenase HmoA
MIRHLVLWKLKDHAEGASAAENALKMKAMLEALNGKIPGMRRLEVGVDFSRTDTSADVALCSEFETREALEAYQHHPEHELAKAFIGAVRSERRLADYEVP